MNGFRVRWIIIFGVFTQWRNFPHSHLVGRIGEQLFKRLRVSPVVSNLIDVRILRFPIRAVENPPD